jgi:hypothetical protein
MLVISTLGRVAIYSWVFFSNSSCLLYASSVLDTLRFGVGAASRVRGGVGSFLDLLGAVDASYMALVLGVAYFDGMEGYFSWSMAGLTVDLRGRLALSCLPLCCCYALLARFLGSFLFFL